MVMIVRFTAVRQLVICLAPVVLNTSGVGLYTRLCKIDMLYRQCTDDGEVLKALLYSLNNWNRDEALQT